MKQPPKDAFHTHTIDILTKHCLPLKTKSGFHYYYLLFISFKICSLETQNQKCVIHNIDDLLTEVMWDLNAITIIVVVVVRFHRLYPPAGALF